MGLLKPDPLTHGWDSSDFGLTASVVSDAKRGKDEESEEVVNVLSTGETKVSDVRLAMENSSGSGSYLGMQVFWSKKRLVPGSSGAG